MRAISTVLVRSGEYRPHVSIPLDGSGLVWSIVPEIWMMEGAGEGGTVSGLLTCWYRL